MYLKDNEEHQPLLSPGVEGEIPGVNSQKKPEETGICLFRCLDDTYYFIKDFNTSFGQKLTIAKNKIYSIKPRFSAEEGLYLLVALPGVIDGASYGILSFVQILDVLRLQSASLREPIKVSLIAIMPFFAGLGVSALNVPENIHATKNQIKEKRQSNLSTFSFIKSKLQLAVTSLKNEPALNTCLLGASVAEGVIFYTTVGRLMELYGGSLLESVFFYPTFCLSNIVVVQNFVLNGRYLKELLEKGYTISINYDEKINNKLLKLVTISFVNTLPLIFSAIMGLLGAADCRKLFEHIMTRFEKEDIAESMSWFPGFLFGALGVACHVGVYARLFKIFLAKLILESTTKGPKIFLN